MALKTKIDVDPELQLRQIDVTDIKQFNRFFSDRFEWYLNNTHLIFGEEHKRLVTKLHICIGTYPDVEQSCEPTDYFEHYYIKWLLKHDKMTMPDKDITIIFFFDKKYACMTRQYPFILDGEIQSLIHGEHIHFASANALFYKHKEPKLKYWIDDKIFYIESIHTVLVFCPFYLPTSHPSVEDLCKMDIHKHPSEHPLRYVLKCQLNEDPVITGWTDFSKSLMIYAEDPRYQLYIFNDALTYERAGPQLMLVNNRYLSYFGELGVILNQLHLRGKDQQVYSNIPNMSKKYQWPRLIEYYSLGDISVLF